MIIYKTTNLKNNKIYVGQDTKNDPKYIGSGLLLTRSIAKYGKENFKKEILEYCTKDNINEREIYWIDILKSSDKQIGYNISLGGQGGILCDVDLISGENHYLHKMSEEDRENHLNTFRRGLNYWKSKGFESISDVEEWIKENWSGENHSHKKNKTKEEYDNWFKSTNIGENFKMSHLKDEERKEYFKKVLGGKNNPIYRNKTDEEIENWLNKYRRGDNAPNIKYEYTIIKPDGEIIITKSLKKFCEDNNYKHTILYFLVDNPTRVPKNKDYRGWIITKTNIIKSINIK